MRELFLQVAKESMSRLARPLSTQVPMSRLEQDRLINYEKMFEKLKIAKEAQGGRPLTLAEKIVFSHLDDPADAKNIQRGKTYLKLRPGALHTQKQ